MKIPKSIPVIILVGSMILGILSPIVQANVVRSISIAIPHPEQGVTGTVVTVSGSTNPPNMLVDICFAADTSGPGSEPTTPCTTSTLMVQTTSNSTGAWSTSFVVPESVAGNHPVLAVLDADSTILATREFKVLPKISVLDTSGAVGDTVRVTGTGFASGESVTVSYDITACSTVETSPVGSFTAECTVPESDFTFPDGTHQISATDVSDNTASGLFTLIPSVTVNPSGGDVGVDVNPSGTTVTAKARGFIKLAPVTVCFDRHGEFESCQTGTTNPVGSLTLQFPMAEVPVAEYIFDANQTVSGLTLEGIRTATFDAETDLNVVPDHSTSPLQVEATGTGFAANSFVTVKLRQRPTGTQACTGAIVLTLAGGTLKTRDTGSFFLNFSTPTQSAGLYQICATDDQGNSANAFFAIGLFVRFLAGTPNEGKVGDTVTIQGYAFKPHSTISLQMVSTETTATRFCDTITATFQTNSEGDFGTSGGVQFNVPQCNRGDYKIVATDLAHQSGSAAPYTIFPWINITPTTGVQGTTVTVTGTGFTSKVAVDVIYFGADGAYDQLAPRNPIGFTPQNSRVIWNGSIPQDISAFPNGMFLHDLTSIWQIETVGGETTVATVTTGNFGDLTTTFTIPESWGGFHPVYAREDKSEVACGPSGQGQVINDQVLCGQPLRNQPTLTVAPNDPKAGESLTVTGTGYMWWEHYAINPFSAPRGALNSVNNQVNNVFRLAFDFGRTVGYVDEARHILNGQRDTSWDIGAYLPVALNQKGTIVYWDFSLESHGTVGTSPSVVFGGNPGALGMVGTPFIKAPALQPGDANVVAYRLQLGSLPSRDYSEQTLTTVTLLSAEKTAIDNAKQGLTDHITTTVSNAQTAILNGVGSAITTAQNTINGAVSAARDVITGHVDTSVSTINTHVDSAVSNAQAAISGAVTTAQTAINSHVDTAVTSAQTSINGAVTSAQTAITSHVDTSVNTINTHVDTAVNSAQASINGAVTAAQTAINSHIDTSVGDINSHVDTAVSSAQTAINSKVADAQTSINNAVTAAQTTVTSAKTGVDLANQGISDLKDAVPLSLQTPMGYVIAILAAIAALASIAAVIVMTRRLRVAG